MSAEGKTPPIKIPIELTVEDTAYDKVRKAISKRKKTREELDNEKILKEAKKVQKKRVSFGKDILGQIPNFGNPIGIVKTLASRVVPIAVALVVIAAIQKITNELTRKGGFFDLTFRNIVDNRINVLRSRESQQEIRIGREGKSQLILTTRAGTTTTAPSYNSYEQIENNGLEFEKMRAIRSDV